MMTQEQGQVEAAGLLTMVCEQVQYNLSQQPACERRNHQATGFGDRGLLGDAIAPS